MNVRICVRNISYNILAPVFMRMPSSKIRTVFLRLYGAKIGKGGKLLNRITVMSPWLLVVGENVIVNTEVVLDARGGLTIGDHVDIARAVYIWTGQHDYNDDSHKYITQPVYIEDYVWIASRATVLPGCRICKGAVIASCALVTKDVEEKTVVGGIPAKVITSRINNLAYKLSI